MRALVIQPGGAAEVVDAPDERAERLTWLYATIAENLTAITVGQWSAYLDDDGISKQAELNFKATNLARAAGWRAYDEVLLGTVVFCGMADDGEDANIPDRILELADAIGLVITR